MKISDPRVYLVEHTGPNIQSEWGVFRTVCGSYDEGDCISYPPEFFYVSAYKRG